MSSRVVESERGTRSSSLSSAVKRQNFKRLSVITYYLGQTVITYALRYMAIVMLHISHVHMYRM